MAETVASVQSLCIDCLAVLDLLESLVEARDVQSNFRSCAGCGRQHCMTYRFRIGRTDAA